MKRTLLIALIAILCAMLIAWPAFADRQIFGNAATAVSVATSSGTANIANSLADPATGGQQTFSGGRIIINSAGALVFNSAAGNVTQLVNGIGFGTDGNTGLYEGAADTIYFKFGGAAARVTWTSTYLASTQTLGPAIKFNVAGTAAAPTYSYNGDPASGMVSLAAGTTSLATGGVERMNVSNTMTSFYTSVGPFGELYEVPGTFVSRPATTAFANVTTLWNAPLYSSPSITVSNSTGTMTLLYNGIYHVHGMVAGYADSATLIDNTWTVAIGLGTNTPTESPNCRSYRTSNNASTPTGNASINCLINTVNSNSVIYLQHKSSGNVNFLYNGINWTITRQ